MNLTKIVLKRPVTTVLCVLCLVVFGLLSVFNAKLELTPEMEMPMMVVSTVYAGANPEDINDLITKPIEDEVSTLSGIDSLTSMSNENVSIVLMQYEYGTDMDQAYSDLKKKIDALERDLPEDAQAPNIMEFDINDQASIYLAINNPEAGNLYNYVNNQIVPEFEKLSSVASVDISGGQGEYIRVLLDAQKLQQYHLSMQSVVTALSGADFTYPAGNTKVGGLDLSVSAGVEYPTIDSLKKIPLVTGNGNILYIEDIGQVGYHLEDAAGIGRYNGNDTVTVSIKKQQQSTAMDVSRQVTRVINNLKSHDPNLEIIVINDASDQISSSLKSVFQTMIMAVIVSMVIIFLFFGDVKASLIVGTSIPISILAALVGMWAAGFSLNMITMSALVLGVGMMVDNSIVVLESCFRSTEDVGFKEYAEAAIKGSGIVIQSIIGSTATTCVVFIPMALTNGMSGQLFKPMAFTIVFCMVASLISAMTIVPLCYVYYRPREKQHSPAGGFVRALQSTYRDVMKVLLPKKKTVMFVTVVMLILSFMMAGQLGMEMIPEGDEGTISISIETRPGLTIERTDEIYKQVEAVVTAEEDLDSYVLSAGSSGLSMMSGGGASLTAYLKDDRKLETHEVLAKWKSLLSTMDDCNITLDTSSMMSSMSVDNGSYELILQSTQYDDLKAASDKIVEELKARADITKVHSTLENAAPVVKLHIDPIQAVAEGMTPVQIAGSVNQILSGSTATTLEVNGEEIDVKVEYPSEDYDTVDEVNGIMLMNASGASIALSDLAEIRFEDSPQSITRSDRQYQVTITGDYTDAADSDLMKNRTNIYNEVVASNLGSTVTVATNAMTEQMNEEFSALFQAIAIAVFLVFVVMAAQFESPKFSFMVMTTIPFSLIGSFGLLWLTDCSISMPSLLGFLMLVGTVVNNGILYVDTVNQYRATMDMDTALIEAGATRLRPILMTTLTTIVAMIPMAFAYGDSGEMMQGLALVDVGGLIASTVLALLMLPAYYSVMSRKPKQQINFD
ncbi:MAG: efflux RND transporter permease subunit [Lachnospiraceae bacterium]|jgi:multidrug efflux pump subunit AcrB|nr:efflux RND transporter permease subunit [Lachnospiraceae bacterium]